jgi:hypothetical protein
MLTTIYLILKKMKMTEMTSVGDDRDRSMRLKLAVEEMLKDIDMSGEEWNDHDKNGIPYWENEGGPVQDSSEERLKYMEENGI